LQKKFTLPFVNYFSFVGVLEKYNICIFFRLHFLQIFAYIIFADIIFAFSLDCIFFRFLQKLCTLPFVNYFPFDGVLENINLSTLTKTIFINYFPYDVIYGKFLVNISENSEYTPLVADQFARLFCPSSIFCKFSLFTKLPFVFSQPWFQNMEEN